ncbi:glycosyltransferase [Candidatus Parcubacteria bacterium]|nr:glycosyltransferase [Candidatus Parcubacteria bacterium]
MQKRITVCFFGVYDPEYSRNRVLMRGLEENGVKVIECRSKVTGFKKIFDLIKKHRAVRDKYDIMLVAFPGHYLVPLAKLLCRKKIIFDAFTSMYDSNVFDRQTVRKNSLKARILHFFDWLSCFMADKVLLDTNEHIKYFVNEYKIKKEKFARFYIGASPDIYYPLPRPTNNSQRTRVLFFGTYIPLQGIQYIIKAAKLLVNDPVDIILIGGGQKYTEMEKLARDLLVNNITFISKSPPEVIRDETARADICLGIFGNTNKTKRVIPNKVYECLAMKRPVVTADTVAIRELFTDDDMMLVNISDETGLAKGIRQLANNKPLQEKISANGFNKFNNNATPAVLGKQLKELIINIIEK